MRCLAVLLCLAALPGCATTTNLAPEDAPSLTRLTDGKPVLVTTRDGRRRSATALRIEADSTSWVDARTGELHRFATADIALVTRVRHGQGALEGIGLGLLIGTSMGAAFGALGAERCGDDSGYICGADQGALLGGVLGLMTGTPLGLLFGAGTGHRDRYVLAPAR